jgi:hypothetical protein
MATTSTKKTANVTTFFEEYARALSSFSPERISQFYNVPLAIYSDEGIRMVKASSETLAFWMDGIKQYEMQNIERATPKILTQEQLSEKTFICKVLWRNFDRSDREVGTETNFYILTENNDQLKISGLIIMAQ